MVINTTHVISRYSVYTYFNFFFPKYFSVPEDSEADIDEDTQALLTSDFEIGHYIRERIVPRAVLYYTGNFTQNILLQFNECDISN